jgi:hypothetical protein
MTPVAASSVEFGNDGGVQVTATPALAAQARQMMIRDDYQETVRACDRGLFKLVHTVHCCLCL